LLSLPVSFRFPECDAGKDDLAAEADFPLDKAGSAPIWLHVFASRASGLALASSWKKKENRQI
jgi:hypothetical protein